MSSFSRPLTAVVATFAAGSLVLTGCANNSEGGGPTGSPTPTVTKQQSLADLVPADIAKKGTLVVGVNLPYAPNEYMQGGKIVGFDVDLMNAVAAKLGLTADYRQSGFEKIIPAVQAGTYDVGMSSFTDTKEREQSVQFVDYFSAGILWASPKGTKVDPNNACGLSVAVESNTTEQLDELPALSKACVKAGKKPIDIQQYTGQDEATNALVLGKVDAMSADLPITVYAITQSHGKLQQAGDNHDAAPYGWAIKKDSKLAAAMKAALEALIKDGDYLKICKRWGVQSGAIKTVSINGATS